jgi:hypothetical protein
MTREEVTSVIRAAKAARKLTWQEIAQEVGKIAGLEHLRVSWSKQHVRRTSGKTGLVSRVAIGGFGHPPAMPNQGNVLDIPKDPLQVSRFANAAR